MPFTTLIQVSELQALQASGAPVLVMDCSFDLTDLQAGRAQYLSGHLPGGQFADVHHDLSCHDAHAETASGGRHPLPARAQVAAWLAQRGLNPDTQLVVYDRQGCNFCARLWWMAQWAGHAAVAVLDGGLQAWCQAGGKLETGEAPTPAPGHFQLQAPLRTLRSSAEVLAALGQPQQTLIDARAPARFRGETEPLDPVAGHIPGALNRPFSSNIALDGRFKPATLLQAEWQELLHERAPASVVHYCGSGVSALPNLLAMEIAGLGGSALFAGSWSEWCADATRPVERG